MAREHARILTRIWRDPDFRARTPAAQRAYVLLLTQRDVNYAGVLPLAMARWARASEHTSVEDVELAVKELEDHRFVLVDRDTDEVLIRSFIRNDGLIDQPKVLRVAVREAAATESEALRVVLAGELRRVVLPEGKRGYDGLGEAIARAVSALGGPVDGPVPAPVASPVDRPVSEPVGERVDEPVSRDAGQPVSRDRRNGSTNGSPSRAAARVGAGAVAVAPSVGGDLGGSRAPASTREAPPDDDDPDGPPPTSAPTVGHAHGAQPCGRRHDPTRACGGCRDARLAVEQAEGDAEAAQRAERAAEAERRRACQACDANGWLEHPETGQPVVRCDHETEPRQQLADALGLTP